MAVHLFRAECSKLRRPLFVGVMVGLGIILVILCAAWQQQAHSEYGIFKAGLPSQRGAVFASVAVEQRQVSPLGAGGYAAGMAASLFGALGVMVLAAAHIAGEWSGGTAKTLFVQENRRGRVVLAKFGSVWLAAIAMMLGMWAAVALAGQVLLRVFPTPLHSSLPIQWDYAAPQLGRAVLVLGAFAAIGTLAAVIARNTIGAFFGGFAAIVVIIVSSRFPSIQAFSPAAWIAGWMQFRSIEYFGPDHLWPDAAAVSHGAVIGGIALACGASAIVLLASTIVRSRDVV